MSMQKREGNELFSVDRLYRGFDVPVIRFPAEWAIKLNPPFAGAICRFSAILGECSISVYLDGYNNLGIWTEAGKPAPYWEAYPIKDDTARFAMADTKGLLKAIAAEFRRQERKRRPK